MLVELLVNGLPVECAEFKEGEAAKMVAWVQEKGHIWDANTGHLPDFCYYMHTNDMMDYVSYWVEKLGLVSQPVVDHDRRARYQARALRDIGPHCQMCGELLGVLNESEFTFQGCINHECDKFDRGLARYLA